MEQKQWSAGFLQHLREQEGVGTACLTCGEKLPRFDRVTRWFWFVVVTQEWPDGGLGVANICVPCNLRTQAEAAAHEVMASWYA